MWTEMGKLAQLQGVLASLKDAKIIFYDDDYMIAQGLFNEPPARIESGKLIFNQAEATIRLNRQPNRAVIVGNNEEILILEIGKDIFITPEKVVPGSVLKTQEITIG